MSYNKDYNTTKRPHASTSTCKPFKCVPNAQGVADGLNKIPSHWSLTPVQDKSPKRQNWQSEQSGGITAIDVDEPSAQPLLEAYTQLRGNSENNPSPGKSASGWLERRINFQKLQNGVIASYPRISGGRNPDDALHWYWSYCWAAFIDDRWRTKRIYVPRRKIYLLKSLISAGKSVETILLHLVQGGGAA